MSSPQPDIRYPNDFARSHFAADLAKKYANARAAELEQQKAIVSVAGRLMSKRIGAESFAMLQDGSGRIQVAVSDEACGRSSHAALAQWGIGDIVGVEGILYRTQSGELTVRAHMLRLLVKALRPLAAPSGEDANPRYVHLIVDPEARKLLAIRSRAIQGMRLFLNGTHYMEVETPMLQPFASGAAQGAFATYHNALDMQLYLRRSALPYLARLTVGGMEKIYEINRSFRNDAAAAGHDPEVTMMEIYCAYSNHDYMMVLLKLLLGRAAKFALGSTTLTVQGREIDLAAPIAKITSDQGTAPQDLVAPTFVVDFPADKFPMARRKDVDPRLVERFELYIGGRMIAEGASVVNDPEQLSAEAADVDLRRAIEYGLPPASSAALSIDALAMLLNGSSSGRDVILFPGR